MAKDSIQSKSNAFGDHFTVKVEELNLDVVVETSLDEQKQIDILKK
jgi:hypothetical protein